MMKEINQKFREWKEQNVEASMLQKGLTLVELLIVVVIIGIIAAILVVVLGGTFSKVEGTELNQNSKKLETAILNGTLSTEKRAIPGKTSLTPRDTLVGSSRFATTGVGSYGGTPVTTAQFESPLDGARVLEGVAKSIGLPGFEGDDLAALLAPIDSTLVTNPTGKIKSDDYFVVLNKNQVFKDAALDSFANYKDELAGRVISKKTIIDSDGNYFNGSFEIKASTMKPIVTAINSNTAVSTVFKDADGVTP